MNIKAAFIYQRQSATAIFNRLLFQARLDSLSGALISAKSSLDDFAAQLPRLNPNRKFAGVQDIPLDQVTGSVGRVQDFDRCFRPLKKHLIGRWVTNYLFSLNGNGPSIRAYKVGSQYFVVDGHHRVSVARSHGLGTIRAEVWEYEVNEYPVTKSAAPRLVMENACAFQAPCSCEALPTGC